MNDMNMNPPPGSGPGEPTPMVIPVHYPPPPPPTPSLLGTIGRAVLTLFIVSLPVIIGAGLLFMLVGSALFSLGDSALHERHYSGTHRAPDRIAIVRIDGVIMEGLTDYPIKQIERAARDERVKAVVLRINSPGGSITASDDLHRRIVDLRDGKLRDQNAKKKVVVSMGSLAASGGYYIAAPAESIMAERSTITGSIGVIAAILNISEFAKQHGLRMNVMKSSDIKDSGSMFRPMTAQDRQVWQDMIDHAFAQFVDVVESGRPKLKGQLSDIVVDKEIPDRDEDGRVRLDSDGNEKMVKYVRRRADGGIWTADEAKKLGLIDEIGYLDDAVQLAHKRAGLGAEYEVITYDRPAALLDSFLGVQSRQATPPWDPNQLSAAAIPRLWYLAPHSELAGLLAAMGRD